MCNHNCEQGDTCDCGEPFIGSVLDITLAAVAMVFAASCIGYLWGGV